VRALFRDRTALRLLVTVWIVYTLHFATDVVRETYLAIALGESASLRVDDYLGLHPDLFQHGERGTYINNNPGASMLGAIPFAIANPLLRGLFRWKPGLAAPKPETSYDDPRPNRSNFVNEARRRGVDIKLGLAAASIHAGLMVPAGVAAVLTLFFFLRRRLLALLYAFGTPIFFRTAFLNQNVLIAHAVLLAWILVVRLLESPTDDDGVQRRCLLGIGALLGFTLLCDYSGAPLVVAFGVWALVEGWRRAHGLRWALLYTAGAIGPIAVLLGYQWVAFGNPLLPAQTYMPPTRYSVLGWNGFFWPSPELLWRNLLDPRYGLFAFSPVLAAAFAAPWLKHVPHRPSRSELALIFGAFAALYLFISSVQFAFLQWNTGVRYIVPVVPLLFMALVPVLLGMPRWAVYALVVPTIAISWSVSMTRAAVPEALARVALRGFELPWLTVLEKTAAGYAPFLADGADPVGLLVAAAVVLWLVWRR
jgi:hypothetical protein